LLLLARFENQKIITDGQLVELNSIILQSLERFSSKIEQHNIFIDLSFSKHFTIQADGYLISVIIENLLSNAIKYSPENGQIKIALFEDSNFIVCQISDNGIGIPNEDLAKIYDQFFRSQPMAHANIKGSGLGLSIVKRLCDLLQTEIHFESDINKGTNVRLNFPK